MRRRRTLAAVLLLVPVLAALSACEGKPPRQPTINWQPATLEQLNAAKNSKPVMIVFTDGTEKGDRLIGTLLAYPEIEKAAARFCCMKADLTKKDDPLVKHILSFFSISRAPAVVFIRSSGIPHGFFEGGRTAAEINTQMMQVQ